MNGCRSSAAARCRIGRGLASRIKLQQDRMDRGYLEKWAAELKLANLLERSLREASGWSKS